MELRRKCIDVEVYGYNIASKYCRRRTAAKIRNMQVKDVTSADKSKPELQIISDQEK
jgi:hypothetical protein